MALMRLRYVHEYRDRTGKLRRYVRRPGFRKVSLPGLPGSPEFMEAYQAATAGTVPQPSTRNGPGSLNAVVIAFYRSTEFANLKPNSQKAYRVVLGPILEKHGHRLVRELPKDKARKIIEDIGVKRPGMANLTRAVMRRVLSFSIDLGLRNDNPFDRVPKYNLGTHHTWTDEEIDRYEKRWPLGTRERLALALLLYSGQRVGDVVRMRRADISRGTIHIVQDKTGADMHIPIHPALARAIEAGPRKGLQLIGDQHGRPVSQKGLSALVVRAATLAGLPAVCVPHGLRKAALRRLAEHGSSSKQIAAVSGHASLSEIERYTKRADQEKLARAAIRRLPNKR